MTNQPTEEELNNHEDAELLRFATAGSVDDGKSTLIGRLLYDSKVLFEDQLAQLEESFDLAQLTDGLKAEREQGITIDVAYRFFATPERRFIIADCPGHAQYTRNAVTGFSTADLTLLLVDVQHGVVEQTRRHAYLASVLDIQKLVFCVNKMDLVDYDQEQFLQVESQLRELAAGLGVELHVIPVSALAGDNVTEASAHMPWYQGPTLLELLNNTPVTDHSISRPARFPVQTVIRPELGPAGERAYAGQIASGAFRVGDEIVALPSGLHSTIQSIDGYNEGFDSAEAPRSVCIRLKDDIDVGRGDTLVVKGKEPIATKTFSSLVFWMSQTPANASKKYVIKHGTRRTKAQFVGIDHRVNLHSLKKESADTFLLNDIGHARWKTGEALAVDLHQDNPAGGRMIVIDPLTNETVAALLVDGPAQ